MPKTPLEGRRDSVWASMQEIQARSADGLTAEDRAQWDRLEAELRDVAEKVSHEVDLSKVIDGRSSSDYSISAPYEAARPLTRSQSFGGYVRSRGMVGEDDDKLDFRKYLRGLATGDWKTAAAERRAMAEGTNAAGGFLVPSVLSATLIDLARNSTQVLKAGATLIPMENRTLAVPKWLADPAAAWHTENAAIALVDPTIGSVMLTAHTLAANVVVSRELLEDAPTVSDRLAETFAAQFALKLDMAALYGSGTAPEPLGVKNTPGVALTPFGVNGTTPTNVDFLVDAAGRLADANENPTGIIYSGRTARSLAKLKDTTGQPIELPSYLASIPTYATQQVGNAFTVGTSTDTSDVFVADWAQLLVGIRTELQISVLAERYADYGQVGFVAWMRSDIAVARAKAFDVTTGVRP